MPACNLEVLSPVGGLWNIRTTADRKTVFERLWTLVKVEDKWNVEDSVETGEADPSDYLEAWIHS